MTKVILEDIPLSIDMIHAFVLVSESPRVC